MSDTWYIARCRRCDYTVQIHEDDTDPGMIKTKEVAIELRLHGQQNHHFGVFDVLMQISTTTDEEGT